MMKTNTTNYTNEERYGRRILAKGVSVPANERNISPNTLVIGGTGAGKTTGYIIPNLLEAKGSLVVSDTKGQLYRQFHQYFRDKGYQVYLIDTVDPMYSYGYNPLEYIRRYPDGSIREQDIRTCAKALIPELDKREPIWERSAQALLELLISYTIDKLPPKEQNLISVCEMNRIISRKMGEVELMEFVKKHPDSYTAKKYHEVKSSEEANRMRASVNAFLAEALSPFQYKEANYIFGTGAKKHFNIKTLGHTPTVLFISVSDTDSSYRDVINLFHLQAIQTLCHEADAKPEGRLDVPVHFFLDDFANTKIVDWADYISVMRSRDISCSMIIQSLMQLKNLYGEYASETIVDNCGHILFLGGGQNRTTADYVASRAFITPEEVMCIPNTKLYVIRQGEIAKLQDKILPGEYEIQSSMENGVNGSLERDIPEDCEIFE